MQTNTIVMIDDGVQDELLVKKSLIEHFTLDNGDVKYLKKTRKWGVNHATICADIIQKLTSDIKIVSLKTLSDLDHTCSVQDLMVALEFCEKYSFPLIHMSIGTTEEEDFRRLKTIIDRLVDKGIIIVAAVSNEGMYTIPGSYRGIFGVSANEEIQDYSIKINKDSFFGALFEANGSHEVKLKNTTIITKSSNSFAAPVLTAHIANLRKQQEGLSLKKMWQLIYKVPYINIEKLGLEKTNLKKSKLMLKYINNKERVLIVKEQMDISEIVKKVLDSKNIIGIIYCGYFTAKEKEYLIGKKILFWDKEVYFNTLKNVKCIPERKVSIINFVGTQKNIRACEQYSFYFSQNGYINLGVSNIEYSYLNGFYYYLTNTQLKTLIYIFNNRRNLSFIVLFTNKRYKLAEYTCYFSDECSNVKKVFDYILIPGKFTTHNGKTIMEMFSRE